MPGSGEPFSLRERAVQFASALKNAEQHFEDLMWKERKASLDAAAGELQRMLREEVRGWDQHVCAHLHMNDPQRLVRVLLTADGPEPGAMTFRNVQGEGVCFVSLSSAAEAQLLETVIHESIHALDVTTVDEPTALNQLRQALQKAGVRPLDPLVRDLPHALILLQAAGTVRALVDPKHIDYGETYGVYNKVGEPARIAQRHWNRRLHEKQGLAETIQRICDEALASREESQ